MECHASSEVWAIGLSVRASTVDLATQATTGVGKNKRESPVPTPRHPYDADPPWKSAGRRWWVRGRVVLGVHGAGERVCRIQHISTMPCSGRGYDQAKTERPRKISGLVDARHCDTQSALGGGGGEGTLRTGTR